MMKVKMRMNKLKIYAVIITIILIGVIIYTMMNKIIDYCYKSGSDRTLKMMVSQIKGVGKPISIDISGDILICDVVK